MSRCFYNVNTQSYFTHCVSVLTVACAQLESSGYNALAQAVNVIESDARSVVAAAGVSHMTDEAELLGSFGSQSRRRVDPSVSA